ncbi:hypothetical protein [Haloglycomyces albus]|uniref:hypothetical protein n=1 Tax=Haloglycomyces albus TaxID=526067 RepID=UPI00046CCEAB|nr:hypothetical protein [Haloglycomyces albus]
MVNRYSIALVASLLTITLTACTSAPDTAEADSSPKARDFTSQLTGSEDIDYQPMVSPEHAAETADVIVSGSIIAVHEGLSFDHDKFHDPEYQEDNDMTLEDFQTPTESIILEVTVDQNLMGLNDSAESIYLYQSLHGHGTMTTLDDAGIGLRIVMAGVEASQRDPYTDLDDVTINRPADIPEDAPIYQSGPGWMWFQAESDDTITGVGVSHDELGDAWGSVSSIDDLIERFAAE